MFKNTAVILASDAFRLCKCASARAQLSLFYVTWFLQMSSTNQCTDFDATEHFAKRIKESIWTFSLRNLWKCSLPNESISFAISFFQAFKNKSSGWKIKWIFTPMSIFIIIQEHSLTLAVSLFFSSRFSFFLCFSFAPSDSEFNYTNHKNNRTNN